LNEQSSDLSGAERRKIALEVLADVAERDVESLEPEMDLIGDLNIDSPRALDLLVRLEERLGIEIGDEDAANLNSVGDILNYVDRLP
jgi:acyl carrier protein